MDSLEKEVKKRRIAEKLRRKKESIIGNNKDGARVKEMDQGQEVLDSESFLLWPNLQKEKQVHQAPKPRDYAIWWKGK